MKTLLRIDASVGGQYSSSRKLADRFQEHFLKQNPDVKLVTRDLTKEPVKHLSSEVLMGFFGMNDNENDLAQANELLNELKQADEILISTPVYNFSVPSSLKAYIDLIVRQGETFSYEGDIRKGLLTNKKATIIVARGSEPVDGNPPDNTENYLQRVLQYIGIKDIKSFTVYATKQKDADVYWKKSTLEVDNYFS